jgi:hypothetical protein
VAQQRLIGRRSIVAEATKLRHYRLRENPEGRLSPATLIVNDQRIDFDRPHLAVLRPAVGTPIVLESRIMHPLTPIAVRR